MRALAMFPAVARTQTCYGVDNGLHKTWTMYDGDIGKVHTWSDRDQAMQAYDDNVEVMKFFAKTEQGKKDAQEGIPHVAGFGDDYDRAYNKQMEDEARQTNLSMTGVRK